MQTMKPGLGTDITLPKHINKIYSFHRGWKRRGREYLPKNNLIHHHYYLTFLVRLELTVVTSSVKAFHRFYILILEGRMEGKDSKH